MATGAKTEGQSRGFGDISSSIHHKERNTRGTKVLTDRWRRRWIRFGQVTFAVPPGHLKEMICNNHLLCLIIMATTLFGPHYNLRRKETEAQRDQVTCSRPQRH